MLQKNAKNVQQIAKGGWEKGSDKRLVKQETMQFIRISLLMNLLFPDRPSALVTTINFQQKLHWPRFRRN